MPPSFKRQINYWKTSADRNWETTLSLFRTKHYDGCLFFCHLVIEKKLKGLVVIHTKKTAPYIHHLEKLARLAELDLTEKQVENLRIITNFNVAGRYDDAKLDFYKRCTKEYTKKYLKISKELYLWLKEKYQKK